MTISYPLAIGVYEVTFDDWDACVAGGGCDGYRPDDEGWGRGDRPVVNVSWDDAQRYVDWLSRASSQRYRLLTESEWEYAARAGTTTPFHTGATITRRQANFWQAATGLRGVWRWLFGDYRGQTVPVGSFGANGFGLHDMHGNVWEWVQDRYGGYESAPRDGSAVEGQDCVRVLRGGSWNSRPGILRSAIRDRNSTGNRSYGNGFRVARTLAP